MDEIVEILTEDGKETYKRINKTIAHKEGICHGISAIALIVMGIVLAVVDKRLKNKIKYEKISFKQAMVICISQAIAAAFPGVSRSGITMTVARGYKIDR